MFCKSPICFWLIPLSSSIINAWATCTMFLVSSLMKLLFYPSSFFYVYASSMEYISQLGKGYHITPSFPSFLSLIAGSQIMNRPLMLYAFLSNIHPSWFLLSPLFSLLLSLPSSSPRSFLPHLYLLYFSDCHNRKQQKNWPPVLPTTSQRRPPIDNTCNHRSTGNSHNQLSHGNYL